jgi:hypothetical protein
VKRRIELLDAGFALPRGPDVRSLLRLLALIHDDATVTVEDLLDRVELHAKHTTATRLVDPERWRSW